MYHFYATLVVNFSVVPRILTCFRLVLSLSILIYFFIPYGFSYLGTGCTIRQFCSIFHPIIFISLQLYQQVNVYRSSAFNTRRPASFHQREPYRSRVRTSTYQPLTSTQAASRRFGSLSALRQTLLSEETTLPSKKFSLGELRSTYAVVFEALKYSPN